MKWRRYRFQTRSIKDPRPLVFDPRYPFWVSGYDAYMSEYAVIIAFLPEGESLEKFWDDAYEIEWTEETGVWFVSRFPRPDYFVGEEVTHP